jgi:hypothetical protein
MAMINNASGVYATLGYNFNDPNGDILPLSTETQAHMNSMPAFIDAWQAKDIANNAVGGYFQNPVSSNTNTIITTAQNLITIANTGASQNLDGCAIIESSANALYFLSQSFLAHTNRLSGVTPFTGQDLINPYYDTAMGLGKTALYITNQTDAITNTSPIMGSFTSILVSPQVGIYAGILQSDLIILTDAVTANTLTPEQATQIDANISNTTTYLTNRINADITYYANLRAFVENYNQVKQFSNMGETQTYLINNFIGTPKLLSRLNPE